jgi:arginyl-tRNA synthetase
MSSTSLHSAVLHASATVPCRCFRQTSYDETGAPLPLIVRKQDRGFGYVATDLAGLCCRLRTLCAKQVLYVVGTPQHQHLAMVFAASRMAGWADDTVRLEHVGFGSVLGPDKKMLKSRSGESISLGELLDEGSSGHASWSMKNRQASAKESAPRLRKPSALAPSSTLIS